MPGHKGKAEEPDDEFPPALEWDGPDELEATHIYEMEDLLLWRKHPAGGKLAGTPGAEHPNPTVVGNLAIASIFKEGQIYAVDCRSGKFRWRHKLDYYGHSSVYVAGNLLYGGTSKTLFAFKPQSGKVVWSFTPYSDRGEWIYASPVIANGLLFIGDREGYLNCLDALTGEVRWYVDVSWAKRCDIINAAIIYQDVAIVSTIGGVLLAVNVLTGKKVWRQKIDASGYARTSNSDESVLFCTHKSLYEIQCSTGQILRRWKPKRLEIESVAVADDRIFVAARKEIGGNRLSPVTELVCLEEMSEIYRLPYPYWAGSQLRYVPETGMVYEATSYGLGIVNPETGERTAAIRHMKSGKIVKYGSDLVDDSHDTISLPFVKEGVIYFVSQQNAHIYAVKHP
jgi:outer membrane protein assembly factor BamB